MFGFFKKKESSDDAASRIHGATLDLFRDIGAIPLLSAMHKEALAGAASASDCNDLALAAYRTLTLAAGLARYRMVLETGDEAAATALANSFSASSGLSHIVQMVLESVPFEKDELRAATGEVGMLFQAATLLDRVARRGDLNTAHLIWRTCAKGAYLELPMAAMGVAR